CPCGHRASAGTCRATSLCMSSVTTPDEIVAAMERWSEEFIEQPHHIVGDLPVCPFAKAARLKKSIRFEVLPFDAGDPLERDGTILSSYATSHSNPRWKHCSSFILSPRRSARSLSKRSLPD